MPLDGTSFSDSLVPIWTCLVLTPRAVNQPSENGACPPVCFHGWKWSLTNTESNPTSSARQEKSNSSRGPNCSADALYPSFSNGCSFTSGSPRRDGVRRVSVVRNLYTLASTSSRNRRIL